MEMPLVELPEELQDIVGDLLEQDSEIDEHSQDTTGNNMVADMEMVCAAVTVFSLIVTVVLLVLIGDDLGPMSELTKKK